jgi:hypothetical protein
MNILGGRQSCRRSRVPVRGQVWFLMPWKRTERIWEPLASNRAALNAHVLNSSAPFTIRFAPWSMAQAEKYSRRSRADLSPAKMSFVACSRSCSNTEEEKGTRNEDSKPSSLYFSLSSAVTFFFFYFAILESATAISPPKRALARKRIALTLTVSPLEISAIRASKNGVKSLP